MYINGKKVTIEQLEELADKLIGTLIDDIYKSIDEDGVELAVPGPPKKQVAILNKILKYYIKREEYEKCATLRDLINIKSLQN
tara:strand:+ start:122 stop:370 length:249 start_codon:yes stop_codon:yes gene_type:complete